MGLMNLEAFPKLLFVTGGTQREIYHSPCGDRPPFDMTTCLINRL